MKICSNCHTENNSDSVFCKKCGKKFKKETDLSKVVLLVGVFLVLFSSMFFGILNWKQMDNLFRLLFFLFETCLFYLMSLALKKVSNPTSRIFFIIGLLLTPFTLSLVPYYNLIPSILNNEALIYSYLAIIYFITFIAYILINIKFKGKILNYLSLLSLLISFIFISLIFSKNLSVIGLLITIYMFVLNVLYRFKMFNDNKAYYNFSMIITFTLIPLLIFNFLQDGLFNIIINIITMIIYMIDSYVKMHFNKNSIMFGFAPFIFQLLSFLLIGTIFTNEYLAITLMLLINIVLYFITIIFKNKVFSIITLVLTVIMSLSLSLMCLILPNYIMLVLVGIISIIFNLTILILKKYNFVHFFITLNVLFTVIGLNSWLYNFDRLVIIGFLSIVYLIIYLVLKLIKNKYDFVYLIIMLVIGFVSIPMCLYSDFNIIKLIICMLFAISYVLINIFKEHISLRVIWFVILNGLILVLFNNIYYSLLTISIFTIIVCILLQKATKFNFKPHLLYAEIVVFIITLFNSMNSNMIALFVNVLAFVLGYLSLVNFHNKKAWKIPYIMAGLLYLIKLVGLVVEPIVISSIISIIIVLIIIVSMYLLDRFNSKELVIISLVSLFPYYRLIESLSVYQSELYLIPFIIYAIILLFVIKWKNNTNRNIFILVPFFIFSLLLLVMNNGGTTSTIIDIIFTVCYIIIGLVKKYNLLIYFAIGVLVFTIVIQLFTVLNSMMAIISLLVMGFILIFVAVIFSTKKKD